MTRRRSQNALALPPVCYNDGLNKTCGWLSMGFLHADACLLL
jgi:hypothetical protein